MSPFTEEDRLALREVARAAREAAAREGVSRLAGTLLEEVADLITPTPEGA